MTAQATRRELRELAGRCGVQLAYTASDGRRVAARHDSLLAILAALGHQVSDARSIAAELDQVRRLSEDRVIEPVVVLTPDATASTPIMLDRAMEPDQVSVTVTTEAGESWTARFADLAWPAEAPSAGRRIAFTLELGALHLTTGYHRLHLEGPGLDAEALVMVRPPAPHPRRRHFGVVAPLYAIRGADDWGVGSFSDLAAFASWLQGVGGTYAGTLPLFAGSFREPVDPSPYLPSSRLFWNELFLDVRSLPEASRPAVAALIDASGFRRELEKLAAEPTVDYAAAMDRKREVLTACTGELLGSDGERRAAYERYLEANPELSTYAEFRAADEATSVDYHRYVQFVSASQLSQAATAGAGLYLDLPVGVHPDGYDAWAYSGVFADAGAGAPPDALAVAGQSWGFRPLHPDRLRESGYDYVIRTFREVLRYAHAIRIDHVLGLHRMFWIPPGGAARDGAYVRYHDQELRALIAIEAHRADAVVVGEDLGTVTPAIRSAMDRDGMLHSFVTRFEASADCPLPQPRHPSAASLGTHDLPKFAAYWRAEDIGDRLAAGQIDATEAAAEAGSRAEVVAAIGRAAGLDGTGDPMSDPAVHQALASSLFSLAAGPADVVLVDLGDLLGEQTPDNRPGTGPEAGNWRHRLPKQLEQVAADPAVTAVLSGIRDRRMTTATEGGTP